jgi:PAS domain S-box-containing protein
MWVWPAIFAGAFLVNVTTAGSFATSFGIACGNTGEALLGAYLVARFANGIHVFDRTRDACKFFILAALLSTIVSATIGVTGLSLGGYAKWSQYPWIWLTWWLGDATGDLLVAPFILLWGTNYRLGWSSARKTEAVLLVILLIVIGGVVFGDWLPISSRQYPLDFLCVLVLLWPAFRFGPRETAAVNLLSSGIAVVGTLHGLGPFAQGDRNAALLLLQTFAGLTQVSAIAVATEIAQRRALDESRQHLAAIVESSDDAIIGRTLDGRVSSWNTGATRIFGFSPTEAIGQTIRLILPPDRQSEEDNLLDRIRHGEKIESFETVRQTKEGRSLKISLTASPIRNFQGVIAGASTIARDISPQKQAAEERERLLTSEQTARAEAEKALSMLRRLQMVADVTLSQVRPQELMPALLDRLCSALNTDAAAILLVDSDGEYLTPTCSVGLNEWQRKNDDLRIPLGRGIAGKIAVSDDGLIFDDLSKAELFAPVLPVQVKSLVGAPLRIDGRVIGVIQAATRAYRRFSGDDLHLIRLVAEHAASAIERARLHETQRAAGEAAETANRGKDEFLAMLGHELRNPLQAISLAVKLLEVGKPRDTSTAKAHDIIARQADHLARLVDDLLDISRLTTGKIVLERRQVNLGECVSLCISAIRETHQFGERSLKTEIEPVWVDGDVDRLTQIVTNLLNNALKYTDRSSAIEVSVLVEGTDAVIRVRDNGVGIPTDLLPRIFDIFARGDVGLARFPGGLGLGLALVKRLAELHGGSTEALSEGPGRGSTFVVRLPLITGQIISEPETPGAPTNADAPCRILIVEDNADARESLRELLELRRHEVYEAADGPSGIETALRVRPDLALIDIGLPGFDGYELARQIRSNFDSEITLVAMTGYTQSEHRRNASEAGFDGFLVKPIDTDQLARWTTYHS